MSGDHRRLHRPPNRVRGGDVGDGSGGRLADPPVSWTARIRRRLRAALDHWLASGAADLDERLPAVLAELGLNSDAVQPDSTEMAALSGGQGGVGAALMLSRFDVVLLEPTDNDLDLDGLARLRASSGSLRGGVVLVSHDQEFLSRSVTRVLELDPAQNTTTVFGASESYLESGKSRGAIAANRREFADRNRSRGEGSDAGNGRARGATRSGSRPTTTNSDGARPANPEKQAQKVRRMESRIACLEEVAEPREGMDAAVHHRFGAAFQPVWRH